MPPRNDQRGARMANTVICDSARTTLRTESPRRLRHGARFASSLTTSRWNFVVTLPAVLAVAVVLLAPTARASDVVTYEVDSYVIPMVNLEYADQSGRKLLQSVQLPWRLEVTLDDPRGPAGRGAELRADWRPFTGFSRWVTVRIYEGGNLLCQSTLDVGDATC